jgi:hypothetical protein
MKAAGSVPLRSGGELKAVVLEVSFNSLAARRDQWLVRAATVVSCGRTVQAS